mmetsp:Transcript_25049/g.80776  ORF Transcript_25049/g.80776 Transcript_25049/m.80776 type:complete len:260 (+) Transcript_25049:484-1263(+)
MGGSESPCDRSWRSSPAPPSHSSASNRTSSSTASAAVCPSCNLRWPAEKQRPACSPRATVRATRAAVEASPSSCFTPSTASNSRANSPGGSAATISSMALSGSAMATTCGSGWPCASAAGTGMGARLCKPCPAAPGGAPAAPMWDMAAGGITPGMTAAMEPMGGPAAPGKPAAGGGRGIPALLSSAEGCPAPGGIPSKPGGIAPDAIPPVAAAPCMKGCGKGQGMPRGGGRPMKAPAGMPPTIGGIMPGNGMPIPVDGW